MAKSISFSGHRLDKLRALVDGERYGSKAQDGFLEVVRDVVYLKVTHYIDLGFRRFYVGMSDGIDLWVGASLLELKSVQYPDLEIVCVRPYSTHGSNFSSEDKKVYRELLDSATETVCLRTGFSKWSYLERNRYMVEHSSNLLAFMDDSDSGTGYTVKYARKADRVVEVVDLHALSKEYTDCLDSGRAFRLHLD